MKAITMITACILLCTTSTVAQLSFKSEAKPTDLKEEVELLIVRNAEECLGYESSIYELIGGEREKIAFLYHESDVRTAAANYYNLNAVRQTLNEYSKEGYHIESSNGENLDGRCNRQIHYRLVRSLEREE